ncbi:MAG: GlsB/YeaQ/YmgE family stress response membrane protein [Anaerolineae bacterium]|nr:GlsB/YeaQ/YmgE family stress response membrane protein [Anaerolineae bacterium]
MGSLNCVVSLLVGGLAGLIAGRVIRGAGYGIVGNVLLGLMGSFVGSLTFSFFGLGARGLGGHFLVATAGAVLFVVLIRVFVDGEFAR